MPRCENSPRQLVLDPLDDAAVLGAQIMQPLLDRLMRLGHQMAEGEALQLFAQPLHAHAAGERRVDVERLLGDAGALVRRHEMQRPHIVETISELDEQHTNVVRDSEQQLAEIFALSRLFGDEVEFFDLGEAFDELADLWAEEPVDLLSGRLGILDRVVQNGRDDRRVVELEICQDRRDFERMGKIRIAGGARLLAMRLHGIDIGAIEQILVDARIILPHAFDEFILTHHARGPRPVGAAERRAFRARLVARWRRRAAGVRGECSAASPPSPAETAVVRRRLFAVLFDLGRGHQALESAQQVFLGHAVELRVGVECRRRRG